MAKSPLSRRRFVQNTLGAVGFLSLPRIMQHHNVKSSRKFKIVCVGGHPDDPESGCGGTLAKLAAAGNDVTIIYLTRGEAGIEGKSFTEAASIWMMFITAYGALIADAKVTKGDFVIIPAASSSVGLAAIQLANYAGATPIALTRTSAKRKRLLEAAAAHVIATEETDMVQEVMRITDGKGARVAFDPVGGLHFPKLISALAYEGIVYIYGDLTEGDTPLPVLEMILKLPTVKGYSLRLITSDESRRNAAVQYILKGLETGALKPVIDRTFTFDEMVEAHRYMENNGQFGKIVVTV